MISENNDVFIVRIQQSTQLFVCLDKTSYFELRRIVPELYLGETTAEEHDGLDFSGRDCFIVFPFEAVF